jgi:indolepyruvate ferredoxin oxidoreductase
VRAEGVDRIALVSDDPDRYPAGTDWPPAISDHHRSELDAVQRELRDMPGVSVLLYDQTCAAEKRRRRKRGAYPDPDKRVVINELVCEGCGDCGVQIELCLDPAGRDRVRPQAPDRSVGLQQGFLLHRGVLPVLRDRARRAHPQGGSLLKSAGRSA